MMGKSPKRVRDPRLGLIRQLQAAAGVLLTVVLMGSTGYWLLGGGAWSWTDCLYMAIITLSTVGYGEMLPGMEQVTGARAFTVALILLGSGTLLYFASTITAFLVEGDLRGIIRSQRMQRQIDKLSGHIVLCGIGATGVHVAEELVRTGQPFVTVELDEERIHNFELHCDTQIPYVIGDATDEEVLEQAGIARAKGLVAALHDDPTNLFLTITARSMRDDIRIVAKAIDPGTEAKLQRAGANAVVSTAFIGGMRIVSAMIRPTVVSFLDAMLRERNENRRIEEVLVPSGSALVGKHLQEANLRQDSDLLILAVRENDGRHRYNPGNDYVIEDGHVLIVLGRTEDIRQLDVLAQQ